MDVIKKWEESGLLNGVLLNEHRKILAMSLENAVRHMKTMASHTPEEEMEEFDDLVLPIVRRLVAKAQFVPITDFSGLIKCIQKEYKQFSLENDMEGSFWLSLSAEFTSEFSERHVGMF